MTTTFPIEDVLVRIQPDYAPPVEPLFQPHPFLKVSPEVMFLDVLGVARYYVERGEQVVVAPYPDAEEAAVNLYLNGSALGAILHQRRMMPFHGSSFYQDGKGVMVCGQSGMGKSSITMAACLKGATFINDDISPVALQGDTFVIRHLRTIIKLWDDSLSKLGIPQEGLQHIQNNVNKFYLEQSFGDVDTYPLDLVLILRKHNKPEITSKEITGLDKFRILKNQLYRHIYLSGMPEVQRHYFTHLVRLADQTRLMQVTRPAKCNIHELSDHLDNIIKA